MSLSDEYRKGLKAIEVEELLDLFFYRPAAFVLVKLIYNTSITPNQLTFASMVFGLLAGASYAVGTAGTVALGGLFSLAYNILDCGDGQLARLKKSGTPLGRIIDGVADYVVSVAVLLGIGIGYANASPHASLLWVLVALTALTSAILSIILDFYRNRFLDYTMDRVSVLDEEQDRLQRLSASFRHQPGHLFEKAILRMYLSYSFLQRGLISAMTRPLNAEKPDPREYYERNRFLMRLWTFLGPTTQWSLLILCSFLNRLDWYLYGIVVAGNALLAILLFLQKRVDRLTNARSAA